MTSLRRRRLRYKARCLVDLVDSVSLWDPTETADKDRCGLTPAQAQEVHDELSAQLHRRVVCCVLRRI